MRALYLPVFLLLVLVPVMLTSCASSRGAREEAVGLLRYPQYALRQGPGRDTVYMAISDEASFNTAFTATGTGDRKPDFSGQTVVAIYTPGPGVRMERAAKLGNTMNVYASTCATGITDCPANGLAVATVPRAGNVTQVRFFIDSIARGTAAIVK